MYKILVDYRENAIKSKLESISLHPVEIIKLEVGDIQLFYNDTLLAVIERKTLTDYAASIKDGRMDNKDKMIKLRDVSEHCRLFFLIEGKAYKSKDIEFCKIKYSSILTSIFHLQIEHNIHTIRTFDHDDTCEQILILLHSFDRYVKDKKIEGGGVVVDQKALVAKTPEEQTFINVINCWKSIPGISDVFAGILASTFTLLQVMTEELKDTDLKLRTSDGKLMTKKARDTIIAISKDIELKVKILSKIKGISLSSARLILGEVKDLKSVTFLELCEIKISGKKISANTCNQIMNTLLYKKMLNILD